MMVLGAPCIADLESEATRPLLHKLIDATFPPDEDIVIRVKDMHYYPKVEVEPEVDENMLQLLEDLATEDQVNTSDRKALRSD